MSRLKTSSLTLEAMGKKAHDTRLLLIEGFIHTTLRGYVDEKTVYEIREALEQIFTHQKPLAWVVDALEVETYAGSAVSLFAETMDMAYSRGTMLIVAAATPGSKMRMFLSSVGFSSKLRIKHCLTVEEAEETARSFMESDKDSSSLND